MLERILISGAGGQGIVLLGKLMARTAIETIPHVTFFPAYGAEVRGGASHCQVILSTRAIASPCVEQADILILMNQNGAAGFLRRVAPGGIAMINSSLCRPPRNRPERQMVAIPASAMADSLGSPRSANIVLLGALLRYRPLFTPAAVEKAIRESLPGARDVLAINLKAFRAGYQSAGPAA